MKRVLQLTAVAVAGLAVAALPKLARSADAQDGADVSTNAGFDITDFYGWVDGTEKRVVFVLNVDPAAEKGSVFSTNVQYVVHTSSVPAFGATPNVDAEEDIIAMFDKTGAISLWVGTDEYVTGDASVETGLASADGKLKVFAGLRRDPFFFNSGGFNATTSAIATQAPPFTLDTSGCPQLDAGTASAFATSLKTSADGGAATDAFGGANVLSIVISLDPSLVNKFGNIVSAWASTHTVGS